MKNEEIYRIICEEMGLDYEDAMSKRHKRNMNEKDSRFIFFYIKRITSVDSFNKIASFFGKNHSTVVHGIKAIRNLKETNKQYSELIERCLTRCSNLKLNNNRFSKTVTVTMDESTFDKIDSKIKSNFLKIIW